MAQPTISQRSLSIDGTLEAVSAENEVIFIWDNKL